jgi:hypothetical protein
MGNKLNKIEVSMDDVEKLDTLPEEAKIEKAVDAAEVEKQLIEEERKRLEAEPDPVEIASMMLTLYTPRFSASVDRLSNRQLRRLIKSLVEFPVGKTYRHTDALERECFGIGKNLMDAKYVLIANTYNEHRDEIMAEARKAAAETQTEFNNEQQVTNEGNENG